MNHNVYHIEKQTFHFGGYWLLTGTLFFLYLPTSQFEMQNAYHALSKGLIPDPATFLPVWFIFGIFGPVSYTHLIDLILTSSLFCRFVYQQWINFSKFHLVHFFNIHRFLLLFVIPYLYVG